MDVKTVSLRVTSREAHLLETLAHELGMTKSDVLKEGLALLKERVNGEKSAFDIGADLFGRHGSGRTDTASRRKTLFQEQVRAKRAR
jgi:hypothetical protein